MLLMKDQKVVYFNYSYVHVRSFDLYVIPEDLLGWYIGGVNSMPIVY